jgi:hypothetical protein
MRRASRILTHGTAVLMLACSSDRLAGPPLPGTHNGYYVVPPPYGTSSGDGTNAAPWDLATALAGGNGNRIQPGDTVWLRAGIYKGFFRTSLTGTAAAQIVFRQYPGERATIDGTLAASGAYLTFWGFEIRQSNAAVSTNRVLEANTDHGRFVNLVLHDAGISGVSMIGSGGAEAELYGSIVYNNGHDDNIDHGIYAHNATAGKKYITDNVFFNNCARGIQVYDDGPVIRDIWVIGNVSFDNGTLACASTAVNLLISAPATTSGMVVRDNLLYFAPGLDGVQLRLGNYDTANVGLYNQDIDVEGNFSVGGASGLEMRYQWTQAVVRDNILVGDGATDVVQLGGPAVASYAWTGNTYYRDPTALAWQQDGTDYNFAAWQTATGLGGNDAVVAGLPTLTQVFLRPNKYEPGRAFIVVFNFGNESAVGVNVSHIVTTGDHYEVRNVQDVYAATPVVSGTYSGGLITIPMGGVQPPQPIGRATHAPRTGPAFDVFLLTSGMP